MKILFVGLNSYYTEGLNYQDNSFCKVFLDEGHDVTYISNPEAYVEGVKTYVGASESIVENGVKLIRVDYKFNKFVSKKLKIYKSIYKYLDDIRPDIIYCHSPQYLSVFDIIKYKKNYPNVLVYADTHTGYYNVNTSKWYFRLLYKVYYKKIYKSLEPYLEKYFYIGSSDKEFNKNIFNANLDKLHFLPLGGTAISDFEYELHRKKRRKELCVRDEDILLVHSGKLDEKKNTNWLIDIINNINDDKLKLVIIGNIPHENKELQNLINININKNIFYLGWKNSNDLLEYICASDIYAQPGAQSVTFNNSLCCQTPVIAFKHNLYSDFFKINSIFWIKNKDELETIIRNILQDVTLLNKLKENAKKNKFILDYKTNLFRELNLGDL